MGIIIRQSFWNLIFTYIGVVIGFVNVTILRPLFLGFNQIGTIELLANYAGLFSNVFTLGYTQILMILYPKYKEHRFKGGLFQGGLRILFIGSLAAGILVYLLKDILIGPDSDNGISTYFALIYPWIFFNILFNVCDTYLNLNLKSSFGVFSRELLQRFGITTSLVLFGLKVIDIESFYLIYSIAFFIAPLAVFLYVVYLEKWRNLYQLKFNLAFYQDEPKRVWDIGFWGVLGGLGGVLALSIDRLMLNYYLGESAVGVYATLLPYATLIIIPSRALKKIASSIITRAWEENDKAELLKVYQKSSINQFILGFFVFSCIWYGLPDILSLFGKTLSDSIYVVFFLGLGYVIDMLMGVNLEIISYSKDYKYNTYFILLLGAVAILSNMYFIQIYGTEGAAIATLLSWILVNLLRFVFVWKRFGLMPFNIKTLIALVLFSLSFYLFRWIPNFDHLMINLLIKGMIITFSTMVIVYFGKLSTDFNQLVLQILKKIGLVKKS